MTIHNLLNNPSDLPPVMENNIHQESNDVFVLYRSLVEEDGVWKIKLDTLGTAFYSHAEKLWYSYYDDPMNYLSNMFNERGGYVTDFIDDLKERGVSDEIINQLTIVPENFAYEEYDKDALVFTKEIVGWLEFPDYNEFMKISK